LNGLPSPPATHPFGEMAITMGRDIFEGANLAGANPVEAGADLLEYWARQLP
jgi:hypothetical protein